MSSTIAELDGMMVTRFCGPLRSDGQPRTMYQIGDGADYVQLTYGQAALLSESLLADFADRPDHIEPTVAVLEVTMDRLRAALAEALRHLEFHSQEYQYRTPPEVRVRLKALL